MKIISIVFFTLILFVITYFVLGIATILKNGTSIMNKPGSVTRIKRFLSTNTAQTQENSSYPELRTRKYDFDNPNEKNIENTIEAIKNSTIELGYEFDSEKSTETELYFTITTKLFKFVDDLKISLQNNGDSLLVNAQSSSRKGRADFGANVANIRKFFIQLDQKLQPN